MKSASFVSFDFIRRFGLIAFLAVTSTNQRALGDDFDSCDARLVATSQIRKEDLSTKSALALKKQASDPSKYSGAIHDLARAQIRLERADASGEMSPALLKALGREIETKLKELKEHFGEDAVNTALKNVRGNELAASEALRQQQKSAKTKAIARENEALSSFIERKRLAVTKTKELLVSPDGRYFATVSARGQKRNWEFATGEEVETVSPSEPWLQQDSTVPTSQDGKYYIQYSEDRRDAQVVRASDQKVISTFKSHLSIIVSAKFSHDGSHVMTTSMDGTSWYWNTETAEEVRRLTSDREQYEVADLSTDGKYFLTLNNTGTIKVRSLKNGKIIQEIPSINNMHFEMVRYSGDGKYLVVKTWTAVIIFEKTSLRLSASANFSGDAPTSTDDFRDVTVTVTVTHGVRMPAAVGGNQDPDGSVNACDATLSARRKQRVSSDRKTYAKASYTAAIRDLARGLIKLERAEASGEMSPVILKTLKNEFQKKFDELENEMGEKLLSSALSSARTEVVKESAKKMAERESRIDRELEYLTAWQTGLELKGHELYVEHAAFSPDGKTVLTTSRDGTARIWNAASGKEILQITLHEEEGEPRVVLNSMANYSPDGHLIVTVADTSEVRVWDAHTGQLRFDLKGHTQKVFSAHFSPDGRQIVTASEDGTIRIWDVATQRAVKKLKRRTSRSTKYVSITSAVFSPDGEFILSTEIEGQNSWTSTARLWNAKTGKFLFKLDSDVLSRADKASNPIKNFGNGEVTSAEFSPNGQLVVIATGDGYLTVWDLATKKPIHQLEKNINDLESYDSAKFRPDGRFIVFGAKNQTAKIWDFQNNKITHELKGHDDKVVSTHYSPDGRLIVTGSHDATARIWLQPRPK